MRKPLILLINTMSARGHLDAYARLYSRCFCDLGCEVVLAADGDGGRISNSGSDFKFVALSDLTHDTFPQLAPLDRARMFSSICNRLMLLWRSGGPMAVVEYFLRVTRRVGRRVAPDALLQLSRRLPKLLGGKGTISMERYVGAMANFEKLRGPRPDLVVFLYMDMFEQFGRGLRKLAAAQEMRWVGIVFHPGAAARHAAYVEAYLKLENCRGAIFLVPGVVEAYARSVPGKHFLQVPDVADLSLSSTLPTWIAELKSHARGRTIVLLVGTIAAQKGVSCFVEVAKLADASKFFFVIVGEPLWESFGEEGPAIREFVETPRENLYAHLFYVQNEADYNSLVLQCDVIYAVYRSFNSSSNSLTKAAGLRKRILVAENTLMGQRVLEHKLGDVAPEDSPHQIYAALQRLTARPDSEFEFSDYARLHSVEALKEKLAEALPIWLEQRQPSRPERPRSMRD